MNLRHQVHEETWPWGTSCLQQEYKEKVVEWLVCCEFFFSSSSLNWKASQSIWGLSTL